MKVSIIIPIYNVEKYIYRCIFTLFKQTYKDIEYIFVDDATPDNSMIIVQDFIEQLDSKENIKILKHSKNKGLSCARNTGLQEAKGDYVYFLDSDDEITNDCIAKLVAPILKNKKMYDICCADYECVGGFVECELRVFGEVKNIDKCFYRNLWYAMVPNKLYRRSFLLKNDLYFEEGIIHEDELFSFMVACLAESMYIIRDKTYRYYVNPNSIMTALKAERHYFCWAIIVCKMAEFATKWDKLNDKELFNYIEIQKSNFSCEAYKHLNRTSFKQYYMLLTAYNWRPIYNYMKGFLNWKRFLKDLCFVFPKEMGYRYLLMWYKLRN